MVEREVQAGQDAVLGPRPRGQVEQHGEERETGLTFPVEAQVGPSDPGDRAQGHVSAPLRELEEDIAREGSREVGGAQLVRELGAHPVDAFSLTPGAHKGSRFAQPGLPLLAGSGPGAPFCGALGDVAGRPSPRVSSFGSATSLAPHVAPSVPSPALGTKPRRPSG
jgi:hypothetical protein